MLNLVRTTAPEAFVTLAECKAQMDITYADDDALIQGILDAAIAALDGCDGMVGKAIATQGYTWTQARVAGSTRLDFPVLPFLAVVSIEYYNSDNALTTASLDDFTVLGGEDFGYIEPKNAWPQMYDRDDALKIVFQSGYGVASAVPANLKQACKMLVSHWYENREASANVVMHQIPFGVESMVNLSKTGWVA